MFFFARQLNLIEIYLIRVVCHILNLKRLGFDSMYGGGVPPPPPKKKTLRVVE